MVALKQSAGGLGALWNIRQYKIGCYFHHNDKTGPESAVNLIK